MRRCIAWLLTRILLWLQRKSEVARFEGIVLSDPHKSPRFLKTLLGALKLIQDSDIRRFRRVQTRLVYIVRCTLPRRGAEYQHHTRTCAIDFPESKIDADPAYYMVWCACTLVHEATHAAIRMKGIRYLPENRSRIEELCVAEEARFLKRLSGIRPDLAARLQRVFNEEDWREAWAFNPLKDFAEILRRARSK